MIVNTMILCLLLSYGVRCSRTPIVRRLVVAHNLPVEENRCDIRPPHQCVLCARSLPCHSLRTERSSSRNQQSAVYRYHNRLIMMNVLWSSRSLLGASRLTRSAVAYRSFASVGDKLPSVDLHLGFPPKKYNLAEYSKGKKIVLLGLPGAL